MERHSPLLLVVRCNILVILSYSVSDCDLVIWVEFWATVCRTVCPILSERYALSCLVCDVGVLWPNGWIDQDATWHGRRPRPWPHCVRLGLSCPQKGQSTPIFGPCVLWPNDWIDQVPLGTEVGLGPVDTVHN